MRAPGVVCLALALASCGAVSDMDAAETQVAAFHRAYDAGKFGPMWDRSASTMQQITPKPQFLVLMDTLRQRLGKVKSSQRTGFNVNYAPGASQVTLVYQTTFANGQGTETFIYDTGKPPRLLGWNVVSPVLMAPGPAPVILTPAPIPAEKDMRSAAAE